eukprot:1149988-Pelagomonas_calceolata.AAC.3
MAARPYKTLGRDTGAWSAPISHHVMRQRSSSLLTHHRRHREAAERKGPTSWIKAFGFAAPPPTIAAPGSTCVHPKTPRNEYSQMQPI